MRKLFAVPFATAGAAALVLGLAAPALAHTVSFGMSVDNAPVSSVVEGTPVTLAAVTHLDEGEKVSPKLNIQQCQAIGEGGLPTGVGLAKEYCADPLTGVWVDIETAAKDQNELSMSFSTDGQGGNVYGFRGYRDPDGKDHTAASPAVNLTITPVITAAAHPGCKGLENAESKVSDKGNAKKALEAVANRLGC